MEKVQPVAGLGKQKKDGKKTSGWTKSMSFHCLSLDYFLKISFMLNIDRESMKRRELRRGIWIACLLLTNMYEKIKLRACTVKETLTLTLCPILNTVPDPWQQPSEQISEQLVRSLITAVSRPMRVRHMLTQSELDSVIDCCQVFSLSMLLTVNCLWSVRQLSRVIPGQCLLQLCAIQTTPAIRVFLGARGSQTLERPNVLARCEKYPHCIFISRKHWWLE